MHFYAAIAALTFVCFAPALVLGVRDPGWNRAVVWLYVIAVAALPAVALLVGMDLSRTLNRKPVLVWAPLPQEIANLAGRMGVAHRVKRFGWVEGWTNAMANVRTGEVLVGLPLKERLTSEELTAVVAHEFGHIQQFRMPRHLLGIALLLAFAGAILFALAPLDLLLSAPGSVAVSFLVFWAVRWRCERVADSLAARYVGKVTMRKALASVQQMTSRADAPSFTHPSFAHRQRRLAP